MSKHLRTAANYMGIDRESISIIINRLWSLAKGPVTTVFQIMFLTANQQGLWYTFLSLGALTSFAELGFTSIITQFVSHEYAHVSFLEGKVDGEKKSVDKLFDLIRYSLKFYCIVVPIAVLILCVVGAAFFKTETLATKFCWLLYAISGGIALMVSLLQAVFLGLDKIIAIQKNILIGSVITTLLNWCLLALGFGVFTLSVCSIAGSAVSTFLLYKAAPAFWHDVLHYHIDTKYKWFKDIVGLQLKYAISWISGYFIFNFYTPTIFKIDGAVLSGQFGMTISIISAVMGMAYALTDSKIPKMNVLAEEKKEEALWQLFKKVLTRSFLVACLGNICLIVGIIVLQNWSVVSGRFVPPNILFLIMIFQFVNFISGSIAKCLRAYKEEPFCSISVFVAVITCIGLLVLYPLFGIMGMLIFIDIIYVLVVLPWSFIILHSYKVKKLIHARGQQ